MLQGPVAGIFARWIAPPGAQSRQKSGPPYPLRARAGISRPSPDRAPPKTGTCLCGLLALARSCSKSFAPPLYLCLWLPFSAPPPPPPPGPLTLLGAALPPSRLDCAAMPPNAHKKRAHAAGKASVLSTSLDAAKTAIQPSLERNVADSSRAGGHEISLSVEENNVTNPSSSLPPWP